MPVKKSSLTLCTEKAVQRAFFSFDPLSVHAGLGQRDLQRGPPPRSFQHAAPGIPPPRFEIRICQIMSKISIPSSVDRIDRQNSFYGFVLLWMHSLHFTAAAAVRTWRASGLRIPRIIFLTLWQANLGTNRTRCASGCEKQSSGHRESRKC